MDTSSCTEIIEKIGENHLVVKKVLYDKDGKEVVVEAESYGEGRILELKARAQAEVDTWNAYKLDIKKIDEEITKAQANLTRANLLQTEMAKPTEK
jgi:hypothetical protein